MLIILSPAKTLDMTPDNTARGHTVPVFKEDADQLAAKLSTLSVKELSQLMDISGNLSRLTFERYRQWNQEPPLHAMRQAILAYKGEAYAGLDAGTMTEGDLAFAQDHLRILSGLYGILRPLDLIRPYRLEIGTRWRTASWRSLYEFWGDRITTELNNALASVSGRVLVNLASDEYYRAVIPGRLKVSVIRPVFKDQKGGDYRVVSVYSKKARGMMASYLIRNRIGDPGSIKHFTEGGYSYNERLSTGIEWVFTR